MKFKVFALSFVAAISFSGLAVAEEMAATPVIEQAAPVVNQAVNVGNKICPVSGSAISTDGTMAPSTVEYNGKTYNLCCPGCKDQFLADPAKYSAAAEAEAAAGQVGVKVIAQVEAVQEAPVAPVVPEVNY